MKEKLRQDFTDRELMVIAAAREIRDDDLVFVGMRLPLIAFAYAKRTHAPGAIGLFENGIVRDRPAPETLLTMSDLPNIAGAQVSAEATDVSDDGNVVVGAANTHSSHTGQKEAVRWVSPFSSASLLGDLPGA